MTFLSLSLSLSRSRSRVPARQAGKGDRSRRMLASQCSCDRRWDSEQMLGSRLRPECCRSCLRLPPTAVDLTLAASWSVGRQPRRCLIYRPSLADWHPLDQSVSFCPSFLFRLSTSVRPRASVSLHAMHAPTLSLPSRILSPTPPSERQQHELIE